MFWFCGQAGTDKTTIALMVAEGCKIRAALGASFIFSRPRHDRSKLRHVFPTIAKELGRQHKAYEVRLAAAIEKDEEVASLLTIYQLEELIVGPL